MLYFCYQNPSGINTITVDVTGEFRMLPDDLGKSGFGTLRKGEDKKTGDKVAIKITSKIDTNSNIHKIIRDSIREVCCNNIYQVKIWCNPRLFKKN